MATPDNLLMAQLHGQAMRCAHERWGIDDAVVELRAIAKGRHDLVAEVVGVSAGAWCAQPSTRNPAEFIGMGMLSLVPAPMDFEALARFVAIGYERVLKGSGPVHGVTPRRHERR